MARIDKLTSATILAGSELVPIAQFGATVSSTLDRVLSLVNDIPINFMIVGQPATGQIYNVSIPIAMTLPLNFYNTVLYVSTVGSANAAFTVKKISSGVATTIGTLTISAGSNTGCIESIQPAVSFVAGDVLQLVAPTQDATLSDISITFLPTRN